NTYGYAAYANGVPVDPLRRAPGDREGEGRRHDLDGTRIGVGGVAVGVGVGRRVAVLDPDDDLPGADVGCARGPAQDVAGLPGRSGDVRGPGSGPGAAAEERVPHARRGAAVGGRRPVDGVPVDRRRRARGDAESDGRHDRDLTQIAGGGGAGAGWRVDVLDKGQDLPGPDVRGGRGPAQDVARLPHQGCNVGRPDELAGQRVLNGPRDSTGRGHGPGEGVAVGHRLLAPGAREGERGHDLDGTRVGVGGEAVGVGGGGRVTVLDPDDDLPDAG